MLSTINYRIENIEYYRIQILRAIDYIKSKVIEYAAQFRTRNFTRRTENSAARLSEFTN